MQRLRKVLKKAKFLRGRRQKAQKAQKAEQGAHPGERPNHGGEVARLGQRTNVGGVLVGRWVRVTGSHYTQAYSIE